MRLDWKEMIFVMLISLPVVVIGLLCCKPWFVQKLFGMIIDDIRHVVFCDISVLLVWLSDRVIDWLIIGLLIQP